MVYKNGDTYDGHWKDDKKHGAGKIIYKDDKFLIAQRNLKKTQGRCMGISRRKG